MRATATEPRWIELLAPRLVLPLSVLLGGVLLHSMNVLITATLLPSIVSEIGGAGLMSWPTTAFVAASIIAAAATGIVSGLMGNARAFCCGALIYGSGAVACALARSIGFVIAGRFVQGSAAGCCRLWPMSSCGAFSRSRCGRACSASLRGSGRLRW